MPWIPRFTDAVAPSRRLLAYDARAGHLRDSSGVHRGTVYVRLDAFSRQVAGHLWWARWSRPTPMITVYVVDGPRINDVWITGGEVEEELRDWEHGQFRYRGEVFDVEWLDPAESELVRLRWELEGF